MQSQNAAVRKRKMLMVLPIVALPFACLLFYAMGGGNNTAQAIPEAAGLNGSLPSAQLEDEGPQDRLSLYSKADRDSAKQQQQDRNDPFSMSFSSKYPAAADTNPAIVEAPFSPSVNNNSGLHPATSLQGLKSGKPDPDQQMEALNKKLANLQAVMDQKTGDSPLARPKTLDLPDDVSPQMQELEEMMLQMKSSGATGDPELQQMNGMLEKILDIQHPDRVISRMDKMKPDVKGKVVPVVSTPPAKTVEYFGATRPIRIDTGGHLPARRIPNSVFYGIEGATHTEKTTDNTAISAVVHQSQTLVSGATIKIRLEQPAYIEGQVLPKGSFIYGVCALSGERLNVDITSIRYNNELFQVRLSAYDLDGNLGIRIPGSISRDASKQATEQAIQSVAMSSLDPSLGAQAASAGIETAKNLLSKKVKLIRVDVKADYPLLLK